MSRSSFSSQFAADGLAHTRRQEDKIRSKPARIPASDELDVCARCERKKCSGTKLCIKKERERQRKEDETKNKIHTP